MNNLDISFNDEVNFLKDSDKDWIPWISNLLLSAKKEIHKENAQEMSINFVSSEKSMKLIRSIVEKTVRLM